MGNVYNILVRKPEVKRPFGIPTRRREDNIKKGSDRGSYKKCGLVLCGSG
jgi:hypothetical protein